MSNKTVLQEPYNHNNESHMSSTAIGIDLGTTFSATSYVNKHGVPDIIPNEHGERITPSVIFFDNDQIVVGTEAEKGAIAYPNQIVQFVKRHIGDADYKFSYNGKDWNAVELSAQILKALVKSASQRLKEDITQAVITVPAYFGQEERNATIQAAESIGLEVLKIINEPTAAAVAYGLNQLREKNRCLVFDLGGGTFDVTIIEIEKHIIRVKSTDGNHQLGGKDWDDRLMKYVSEAFKEQHGIDIMNDAWAKHELRDRCVNAKLSLTMRPEVTLSFQHQNKPLRLKITRDHFEAITGDLLNQCIEKTMEALEQAKYQPEDIDTILLVGGSTRMPMVQRKIKEIFNKDPETNINPDECVAMGAALTAAIESAIQKNEAPPVDIKTHDVAGHQLGLVVLKDSRLYNAPIIKKNTSIPCSKTESHFITTHPNQSVIDLWLVQGEKKDPLDRQCKILGHFEFYGIPSQAEKMKIAINYRYNSNGIVEVEAAEVDSKNQFMHRLSKTKYDLRDLSASKIPTNIAVIVDSSGSMYGDAMADAKDFLNRFAMRNLRNNRSLAIFSAPDGLVGKPINDANELDTLLNRLYPIGYSVLHTELKRAREQNKGRSGLYIIITDGHVSRLHEIQKSCEQIHRNGGKIFIVGAGADQNTEVLKSLAVHPQYFIQASAELDIAPHLINLLNHT